MQRFLGFQGRKLKNPHLYLVTIAIEDLILFYPYFNPRIV